MIKSLIKLKKLAESRRMKKMAHCYQESAQIEDSSQLELSQNNFNDIIGEPTQLLGKSIAPMSQEESSSSSQSQVKNDYTNFAALLKEEKKNKIFLNDRRASDFSFSLNDKLNMIKSQRINSAHQQPDESQFQQNNRVMATSSCSSSSQLTEQSISNMQATPVNLLELDTRPPSRAQSSGNSPLQLDLEPAKETHF